MKQLFIAVALLLFVIKGVAQKGQGYNSAVAAVFDKLNNKSFATLDMEDTSGTLFNTTSLSGKTIYVDFWFTACAPCIKEIPYARSLQEYFVEDTNVVFLNICIESTERKKVWKQMIRDKEMKGIQLFYERNRPQKINLLREYNIMFPTYLLVNKEFKIIGYDAPRPSEEIWIQWAITQAAEGKLLSAAYKKMMSRSKDYQEFVNKNPEKISYLNKAAD